MRGYTVQALPGLPLVAPGDDVPQLIATAIDAAGLVLVDGDVLVVTSKILSKAEGRVVALAGVTPSEEAHHYAAVTRKDPRMVEIVLRESNTVSRASVGVLVVEHRLGFVCANAGVDQSNLAGGEAHALLLPEDPDQSAQTIRNLMHERYGADIGVIVSDSHGRPFRMGNIGVAIGVAGMPGILDLRGDHDLFGRELKISIQGYADLVASAAQLATGEGAEGLPVVLVRGLAFPSQEDSLLLTQWVYIDQRYFLAIPSMKPVSRKRKLPFP
ncbi:MAG: coenzyme F420-0:L-glutamate ligase [Chloroflexota bacterium]